MQVLKASYLSEVERLLRDKVDPEFEAWRADRHRYVDEGGRVFKVKTVRGGSFLTGTQTETIYVNQNPGTAKNTFTTEAVINDTAGAGPQPVLPPYFWGPAPYTAIGRAIRIVARGIRTDVTTTPTWQLFCRLGAAASTAGPNIGSSAATQISATAATNLLWEYELDAQLTVAGAAGGNSTIRGLGFSTWQATTTTLLSLQLMAGGASPGTVSTVDISTTNYVNFDAACGTSSASNSIQLLQLVIMGLN